MSRMRSGLKPSVTSRRSPTKFPPVRTGWGANSPPLSSHTRDPEWSHDIVRGIQLKTVSKTPSAASNSPRKSSGKEEVKTPSPKQEEKAFFSSQQNGKDKEIEKLKLKIISLQRLIEQLRAEIKEKTGLISELEEKLKVQEASNSNLDDQIKKLKAVIGEKEKEIVEQQKIVTSKDVEINQLKESFSKEKDEIQKEFDHQLEELKALHLKELAVRDGKIKVMKMQMADALKDNSRERQLQLEELTKELKRVTEETGVLKSKLQSMKSSNQGQCSNCFVMERQLQSKIAELRDKEIATIELQRLCSKMEKQLVQQDELLRQWAKNKGKPVR